MKKDNKLKFNPFIPNNEYPIPKYYTSSKKTDAKYLFIPKEEIWNDFHEMNKDYYLELVKTVKSRFGIKLADILQPPIHNNSINLSDSELQELKRDHQLLEQEFWNTINGTS